MAYDLTEGRDAHGRWVKEAGSSGFKRPTVESPVAREPSTLEEHSMVGLIRLSGHHGLDKGQTKALLKHLGHNPADGTINIQLANGRKGIQVPKLAESERWHKLVQKFKGGSNNSEEEPKETKSALEVKHSQMEDYWVHLNSDGSLDDVNKGEVGQIGVGKFVYKVQATSSSRAVSKVQTRYSNKEDSDHPWGLRGSALSKPESLNRPFLLDTQIHSPVSDSFKSNIRKAEAGITPAILEKLRHLGAKLHLGEFVLDMRPDLRGQHPRGWPKGETWDRADGLALGSECFVSEKLRLQGKQELLSSRTGDVYRHEMGHVADNLLGGAKTLSSDPIFVQAHQQDVGNLSESDRLTYAYEIQPGSVDGGRKETFAEIFAELHGGGCNTNMYNRPVSELFPLTALVVKNQLGIR